MKFPKDERMRRATMAEQVHAVILRTLKVIDMICKKHEIAYWLEYGTLLGAIRHKGFIPWDYEADIGMIRTDYEKFVTVIKEELPEDLFFQSRDTDPYYIVHSIIEGKIRDRYSDYIDEYKKYENCNWLNGIQVDIFVYDLDRAKSSVITNKFERFYSKGAIYLKFEEIESTINVEFADYIFPIPIGYDSYLRRAYGDYLQLPPSEQQIFPNVNVSKPCLHPEAKQWKENPNL